MLSFKVNEFCCLLSTRWQNWRQIMKIEVVIMSFNELHDFPSRENLISLKRRLCHYWTSRSSGCWYKSIDRSRKLFVVTLHLVDKMFLNVKKFLLLSVLCKQFIMFSLAEWLLITLSIEGFAGVQCGGDIASDSFASSFMSLVSSTQSSWLSLPSDNQPPLCNSGDPNIFASLGSCNGDCPSGSDKRVYADRSGNKFCCCASGLC